MTPNVAVHAVESMTGYGEARATISGVMVVCRARSLNHRFLEVKVRLPRADLLGLDMVVRKHLAKVFTRGAVEVTVTAETSRDAAESVFDTKIAKQYWQASAHLAQELGLSSSQLSMDALVRLPGVASPVGATNSLTESLSETEESELFARVVEPALQSLKSARLQEGTRLGEHLLKLLREMDGHIEAIKALERPEKERGQQMVIARAQDTLKLLSSINPDAKNTDEFASRLREEAVFWIERRDFDEERVRLELHLRAFQELLIHPTEVSGRKLEFLQQELLREVNTLGTKAQSPAITSHTIELKALLERLKEQLANVA